MVSIERLNYLIFEDREANNHILSRHSLHHRLSQEDDSLLISITPNDSFIGIDQIRYHYKKHREVESTNLLTDPIKENLIDRLINYKNLFSINKFEFNEQDENEDYTNITQIQKFVNYFEFGLSNLLVLKDLHSLDFDLNQNSLESSIAKINRLSSDSTVVTQKLTENSLNFIRYFSKFFGWQDTVTQINTSCEGNNGSNDSDELRENYFELKEQQNKLNETQSVLLKRICQLEAEVNDNNDSEIEINQVVSELDRVLHEMSDLEVKVKSNEEKINKLLLYPNNIEIYINEKVDEVNSRINDVINVMNETGDEIEEQGVGNGGFNDNIEHIKLIPRSMKDRNKDRNKDYNEMKNTIVSHDINHRNRIDKLSSLVNDHIEKSNERFTRIENLFNKVFVIVSSLAKKRSN